MSAIFGKCNTDNQPVSNEEMGQMLTAMNQWPADDKHTWAGGNAGLGHLMLYNTPESLAERLPLCDSLAQLTITADARIDNRDELYALLSINTPAGKLAPDSSIILLAYKKYGADCVKYLIGDFAFAIWDEREQQLFCARDQMGVKPFFYYHNDKFFAFASEKKGLLCLPGVDKAINKQYFYNHLFVSPLQAPDTTIYLHIHRLPPAHTLTYHAPRKKTQLNHYWTLDPYTELKLQRKEDYYDGLRHHFEEAVKCRIRSNYPVGVEMSGGLDSSAITGVATHFLKPEGRQAVTFSAIGDGTTPTVINGKKVEDERYMKEVIQFNEIEQAVFINKELWANPLDEVDFILKVNDGLEAYTQAYLLIIKNEAMQRNVRTLLSGFPGDEMVTYRGLYYFLDYLDHKQYLKYFLAKKEYAFKKIKPFFGPQAEFFFHKARNILSMNNARIRLASGFFPVPFIYRYNKGDAAWKDIAYRERFKSYRHFQRYRLQKTMIAMRMENETRFGLYFKT